MIKMNHISYLKDHSKENQGNTVVLFELEMSAEDAALLNRYAMKLIFTAGKRRYKISTNIVNLLEDISDIEEGSVISELLLLQLVEHAGLDSTEYSYPCPTENSIELEPIEVVQVPVIIERMNGASFSLSVSEHDTIKDIIKKLEGNEAIQGFWFGDKIVIPTPMELFNKISKENEEDKPF